MPQIAQHNGTPTPESAAHAYSIYPLYLLALFLSLTGAGTYIVSTYDSDAESTSDEDSAVALKPPRLDFGSVQQHATLRTALQLLNESPSEIQVTAITSTCGCTVVADGVLGAKVSNGSRMLVPVAFSTGEGDGSVASTITVVFVQDGRTYATTSEIHAKVQPEFRWRPRTLLFSASDEAVQPEQPIDLEPIADPRVTIITAESSSPDFAARVCESRRRVFVRFVPPGRFTRRDYSAYIRICTTNSKLTHVTLPVKAHFVPTIETRPPQVIFLMDHNSTVCERNVHITTGRPSQIKDVSFDHNRIRVHFDEHVVSRSHELRVARLQAEAEYGDTEINVVLCQGAAMAEVDKPLRIPVHFVATPH